MLVLASAALAAPTVVASSARLVSGEPAPFEWPRGAAPCRAELVLAADGSVQRVEPGHCGEALRPVVDGLAGLVFERPAEAGAVLEARIVPPAGEQGQTTPVLRPLEVAPDEWPKAPESLATVPAGTACRATVTFVQGEKPSSFVLDDCPTTFAEHLEKKVGRARWSVRTATASPGGFTARPVFAWIEDPARPNKRLLVIEGTALPKSTAPAAYPLGMTGSATCEAAVQVESSGMPMNVTVVGCEPIWERAARTAVQHWTFLPRIVDGAPTTDDYVTTVTFALN